MSHTPNSMDPQATRKMREWAASEMGREMRRPISKSTKRPNVTAMHHP
jgi:hypothetical protein